MSGFSPAWLALREPVDHRSRAVALAARLQQVLDTKAGLIITDLGSGTGSNLRALAPELGDQQEWTLVDYEPDLLEEAALALGRWADSTTAEDDRLILHKDKKTIYVRFRLHDLARGTQGALTPGSHLVTASALFDLTSALWMGRFAQEVAAANAAFYATLTYDGRDSFVPVHPLDEAIMATFALHMQQDKGFGPATGPMAAHILAGSFGQMGYEVERGDSPWVMTAADAGLAEQLCAGIAQAVSETGKISASDIEGWLAFRKSALPEPGARMETGHTDILAYPKG